MDRAPLPAPVAPAGVAGPLAIVMNPRSGNRSARETLAAMRRVLNDCRRPYELLQVQRRASLAARVAQAVKLAAERDGIVVVAGGDGTINAAINAVVRAGLPFGVLPCGTFNFFARRHGVPLDPEGALRVVLAGHVAPVQVGAVNGRLFLVNASLGLYPRLLEDREDFKRRWGRTRSVAMLAGFITLLRERRRMWLDVRREGEDERIVTSTLFVGNNALQLEQVGLPDATAVEFGRLLAVSVRPISRLAMLGLALRGAIGRLGDAEHVQHFPFARLEVSPIGRIGLPWVKVAYDGESAWMRWPLRFEVFERPLWLLQPPPVPA